MLADIRAMRIACLIRNIPELHANWKDAMREALTHVDEATWTVVEDLLHDVLACVADARATAATESTPEDPTPDVDDEQAGKG
jgi:hypothetical protein